MCVCVSVCLGVSSLSRSITEEGGKFELSALSYVIGWFEISTTRDRGAKFLNFRPGSVCGGLGVQASTTNGDGNGFNRREGDYSSSLFSPRPRDFLAFFYRSRRRRWRETVKARMSTACFVGLEIFVRSV